MLNSLIDAFGHRGLLLAEASNDKVSMAMSGAAMVSSAAVWAYQYLRDRPALKPQLRQPFRCKALTYQEAPSVFELLKADGRSSCVIEVQTELILLNYSTRPDSLTEIEIDLQGTSNDAISCVLAKETREAMPRNMSPQTTDRLPLKFYAYCDERPGSTFDARTVQGQQLEAEVTIRIKTLRGHMSAPAIPISESSAVS